MQYFWDTLCTVIFLRVRPCVIGECDESFIKFFFQLSYSRKKFLIRQAASVKMTEYTFILNVDNENCISTRPSSAPLTLLQPS
jgi:hypothetical protein